MSGLIVLRRNASSEEILDAVRRWCAELAAENYEAACAMTKHHYETTSELLKQTIENYGSPEPMWNGEKFKVTPLSTATYRPGDEPKNNPYPVHEVNWFEEPCDPSLIGHVWFDLPLNGTWSDLTATFDLIEEDGGLVLSLISIHVM